jgi:nicotinate-nucleotide adenylyltransferase
VRIAVLGGTFDPIHNGHLAVAQATATAFSIDEVHFVPAYSAPHKQSLSVTSPFHRFAMVALATLPFERYKASTIEVDALAKKYTVDTLQLMQRTHPGDQLFFVLGTDMYSEIETWKEPRRLFELAHLVVVNRLGFSFREDVAPFHVLRENQKAVIPEEPTVFYLPFVRQPISSTEIRDDRKNGRDVRQRLPAAVWNYIERNRLYS